jgi:hypothetical protein
MDHLGEDVGPYLCAADSIMNAHMCHQLECARIRGLVVPQTFDHRNLVRRLELLFRGSSFAVQHLQFTQEVKHAQPFPKKQGQNQDLYPITRWVHLHHGLFVHFGELADLVERQQPQQQSPGAQPLRIVACYIGVVAYA